MKKINLCISKFNLTYIKLKFEIIIENAKTDVKENIFLNKSLIIHLKCKLYKEEPVKR